MSRYGVFSGPYFPVFGLNTEIYEVSRYGVFSGPHFPVFGLNTGKYGPEKTPYLDTFYAVVVLFLGVDIFPVPQVFRVVSEDTGTNKLRRILQISLISFVVFATIVVVLLFIASWDRAEKRMKSKIAHNIPESTW